MPVRKDSKGHWHVDVCVNRKRIHRQLPENSKKSDAKRLEAQLRAELAGTSRKTLTAKHEGDPDLISLMAYYTEVYVDRLRSPDTSRQHANRIGPWLDGYRASQTRQVASKIISDLTGHYAPATINKSLNTLSRALSLAFERGLTDTDYSTHIKRLPENNFRERVLTIAEVEALAAESSEAVEAAIWIGLYTGMRRGEIVKLRPEHIQGSMLNIPAGNTKSYRLRQIPIARVARPWIDKVPLGIKEEGVKSGFRRARERAKIEDVTFHDLRRSCGTMLIQAGTPVHIVSKILGHSSTTVTQQRYAHLADVQMVDAVDSAFG